MLMLTSAKVTSQETLTVCEKKCAQIAQTRAYPTTNFLGDVIMRRVYDVTWYFNTHGAHLTIQHRWRAYCMDGREKENEIHLQFSRYPKRKQRAFRTNDVKTVPRSVFYNRTAITVENARECANLNNFAIQNSGFPCV